MDRWIGKVVVITGASSGIGAELSVSLVQHGLKVIGLARRVDRLQEISDKVKNKAGVFKPIECNVSKEEDLLKAFMIVKNEFGGVDIMINNAGVVFVETIIDGLTENFKNVLDVNVLSAAICTREASRSMRDRSVQGHIININSVVGHNASIANSPLNLYHASKYALRAISEVTRNELSASGASVKVTNLSPGLVKTEMPARSPMGEKIFDVLPHLLCQDIVDAVLYILGTPPNVQVAELTIVPLKTSFEGIFYESIK